LSIVAACELIQAGQDVVARKKMREEAEVRLGLVRKALGSAVPATARPGPHVWLPMPLSAAEQLARRAIERGVRLTPPTAPLLDPTSVSGVRLCTLAPRQRSALAAALSQLADIVAEPDDFVV
jgi:DNA-binding transcriptional MocR family regulator